MYTCDLRIWSFRQFAYVSVYKERSQKSRLSQSDSSSSSSFLCQQSQQQWSHEESPMDLSDSLGKVNLSGILNKTLEGTSEMLKLLEDEETTTMNQTTINQTDESFFEDK